MGLSPLWAIATSGAVSVTAWPAPSCAPSRSASVIATAKESTTKEVQHQRHSESGRGAVHDSNAHAVPFHTLGAGQPESNGTNRVCGLRPDADRSTNETPTRL